MFINQLAMIQEKTRGNLTNEETTVLRNALSNLQMAYVEVARQVPRGGAQPPPPPRPARTFLRNARRKTESFRANFIFHSERVRIEEEVHEELRPVTIARVTTANQSA